MGKDRRRNDEKRIKNKVKKILKNTWGDKDRAEDEKVVGKMAHTPHGCSCRLCGNPRKHEKGETALTMQERRAVEAASDETLPSTVEEAVTLILKEMVPEDISSITRMDDDDLILLHHGFGTHIRNRLGLWGNNNFLLKDTGYEHPDDASMVIIKRLWVKLQAV